MSDKLQTKQLKLFNSPNVMNIYLYYLSRKISIAGLLGLLFLLNSYSLFAQVPNSDDCATAAASAGTNPGIINQISNMPNTFLASGVIPNAFANEDDMWIKLNTTNGSRYIIRYTPSENATLQLYSGVCGGLSSEGSSNLGGGTTTEYIVLNATLTSYLLRIQNLNDDDGMNGNLQFYEILNTTPTTTATVYDLVCETELGGVELIDFNTNSNVNFTFNIPAFYQADANVPAPNCPSVPTPILLKDGWMKFISPLTGSLTVIYSPSSSEDIWLATYDADLGCASVTQVQDNILQCADENVSSCAESLTMSVVKDREYYVRVGNKTTNAVNGTLTIYPGPKTNYDLLNDAQVIAVGSCNTEFNLTSNFYANENRVGAGDLFTCDADLTLGGTQNVSNAQIDGWLKVDLAANTRVSISYTSFDKDAGLAVYSGDCGATLTQENCVNAVNGAGIEEMFVDVAALGTYYIRVMNLEDNQGMTGTICIKALIPRDLCSEANSPFTEKIKTGDCNVQVDVPLSFGADALQTGCIDDTKPAAWAIYKPSANNPVRLEYFSTTAVDFGIVIFEVPTGAGVGQSDNFCATVETTPYTVVSCRNANSIPSFSADFTPNPASTYFISVINAGGADLKGFLCVYENQKKAEDLFYTSNEFVLDGSDCGRRFNILSTFGESGYFPNPDFISCSPDPLNTIVIADAWANFEIATVPTNGVNVSFSNDNTADPVAFNTAVLVYRGENLARTVTPTFAANNTCASAIALPRNEASNTFNLNAGEEVWFSFTTNASPTNTSLVFENATGTATVTLFEGPTCPGTLVNAFVVQDANKQVYPNPLADPFVPFVPTPSTTYFVRVEATTAITSAEFAILDALTEVACVDVGDNILLQNTTYPNFISNHRYYVRVVSIPDPLAQVSITGTLCIKNNSLREGDVCSNAFGLQVGDCDIDLGFDTEFSINQPLPTQTCGTNLKDMWVSLTATSSNTTFTYYAKNKGPNINIALEAYSGSCSGLTYIACTGSSDEGAGIEKLSFVTEPGLVYYVRVMNIAGINTTLVNGNLCIYDTPQRDDCDNNDLLTKVVGECNIQFDVPTNFTLSEPIQLRDVTGGLPITETGGSTTQTVESACDINLMGAGGVTDLNPGTPARDAWMRMAGNGNDVTLVYETKTVGSNPAIVVYTALQDVGPVTCGVGKNGTAYKLPSTGEEGLNQYACSNKDDSTVPNATTPQTEFVTFKTNAGQVYIIRVIELNGANTNDMEGLLCISDGSQRYPEPCDAREIELGDCGISLDLINNNADCIGEPTGYNPANMNALYGDIFNDAGYNDTDCEDCQYGDVFAKFTRPIVCDPAVPAVINNQAACETAGYTWNATATVKCGCKATTIPNTAEYGQITIQYDNKNGVQDEAGDVSMVIYRLNTPETTVPNDVNFQAECDNLANYNYAGTCQNTVVEGVESVLITGLSTAHGSGGENFIVRVIRKTPNKTIFGKLCTFYGTTLGQENCSLGGGLNRYGEFSGEYRDFRIPAKSPGYGISGVASALPTKEIPSCVIPNGSTPKARNTDPIRSQAWMAIDIPTVAEAPDLTAITVQYDNSTFTPLRNVALAVYRDCSALFSDEPVSCANGVFVGAESVTLNIENFKGQTLYVRVMNVHNVDNPTEVLGRIRVFPYSPCQRGGELVVDGSFSGWPAIQVGASGLANNNSTLEFDRQDEYTLFIPRIDASSAYPNDLDRNQNYAGTAIGANTGIARFATDYGYLRDRRSSGSGGVVPVTQDSETYGLLKTQRDELSPEGRYLIRQSPWTVKGDWFSYGTLWSGYGGNTANALPLKYYCASGTLGQGSQACEPIVLEVNQLTTTGEFSPSDGVTGGIDRPEPIPTTSDANFMIVNGSYDPNKGLPPGKVWCQTIQRDPANVGYYVFEIWLQNMKSAGNNRDIPQIRLTVCDMADADGLVTTLPKRDIDPSVLPGGVRMTRLPGITDPSINAGDLTLPQVEHLPRPPIDRIKDFLVAFSYGAGVSCNVTTEMRNSIIAQGLSPVPDVESRDARLKVLGSSFIVTENPDKWRMLRCIYKAPLGVDEMNICIENLSITKNGNDFGIDDISFRECLNPDVEAFERLLKGDPCELTDNPLGSALPARLLTFSGKLLTNKIALNWLTIAENNTIAYEVQRSLNGNTFSKIGSVDGKGTSQGMADYQFTDYNLPLGASVLYYRLNFIQDDGTSKIGPVIAVSIDGLEAFEVDLIPNPTNSGEDTKVRFNADEAGVAGIVVADMTGRRLHTKQINVIGGENIYLLDTKGFRPGIYIVKVINANGQAVSKKLSVL